VCTGSSLIVIVLDDRQGGIERKMPDERQFEILIKSFTIVLKVVVRQVPRRGKRKQILTELVWGFL
jgi:hypothetical protein